MAQHSLKKLGNWHPPLSPVSDNAVLRGRAVRLCHWGAIGFGTVWVVLLMTWILMIWVSESYGYVLIWGPIHVDSHFKKHIELGEFHINFFFVQFVGAALHAQLLSLGLTRGL